MMLMFMNNKTQVISAEHFMEKIWAVNLIQISAPYGLIYLISGENLKL